MQSFGVADKIHATKDTVDILQKSRLFNCNARGTIDIKVGRDNNYNAYYIYNTYNGWPGQNWQYLNYAGFECVFKNWTRRI